MIIFENDFVRLAEDSSWQQVVEIVFRDEYPTERLVLADDRVISATWKDIDEVRSENEHYEEIQNELREQEERSAPTADKWEETYYADAIHHAEANQY